MIIKNIITPLKIMGIKNLRKFLKSYYSDVFQPIHISQYAYKKIAIDTSLYLCSYKALYGNPHVRSDMSGWMGAIIKLIGCLRKNDVHCVFVFDGGSPPEKKLEKEERWKNRRKQLDQIDILEKGIDDYDKDGVITEDLKVIADKRSLFLPGIKSDENVFNVEKAKQCLEKMQKQQFSISDEDMEELVRLLDVLKIPHIKAPLEAETFCADLCIQGKVDAVLTEDTDVMAYGTPTFISKFNVMNGMAWRIDIEDVLSETKLTQDQFRDFCIMCGNDYNKNIFRVGPSKSYDLIQKYQSIEKIEESGIDISVLNHVRSRELFTISDHVDYNPEYCGTPDIDELHLFLFQNNMNIDNSYIEKCFINGQDIIVVEEN